MLPIIRNAQKLMSRNASDLLLFGGVSCILAGGIMAIKQTPKALKITEVYTEEPTVEKVKALAPLYAPSLMLAGLGIAQIIWSRNITNNKIAAVATAYTVSDSAFRTYREKVKDLVEPTKYEEIRREVAHEKMKKDPVGNKEVIITAKGNVLIYDEISGRYFRSSMEEIDRAANYINKKLRSEMVIQLNDFYSEIGLIPIKIGCELGWSIDKAELEHSFSSTIAEDGTPCLVLDYDVIPI